MAMSPQVGWALLGLGAAVTGVFVTGAAPSSDNKAVGTTVNLLGVALIVSGVGLALYEGWGAVEHRRVRDNPARGSSWSRAKFDRCVRKVKRRRGRARNAYAICTAASKR